jgi:hypothetical protein
MPELCKKHGFEIIFTFAVQYDGHLVGNRDLFAADGSCRDTGPIGVIIRKNKGD